MMTPNQKNILILASQELRRASKTDAEHQLNIAAIEEAFELLNAFTRMATALENLARRHGSASV
jgi:hypothetical protein